MNREFENNRVNVSHRSVHQTQQERHHSAKEAYFPIRNCQHNLRPRRKNYVHVRGTFARKLLITIIYMYYCDLCIEFEVTCVRNNARLPPTEPLFTVRRAACLHVRRFVISAFAQ